jgi:peptidoglycan hydrolase-like protein with peptidoglycan-binding domain
MRLKLLPIIFFLNVINLFSQDFSRILEIKNNRMYGEDIKKLQLQLVDCGFTETGNVDGYYGPMTEGVIKNIQYFSGFEQSGRVDRMLWDFLFNKSNDNLLQSINIITKYDIKNFTKETSRRMGYSTEGGELEKYFFENEIKQINLAGRQLNIKPIYTTMGYFKL